MQFVMHVGIFGGTFDPIHNGHIGALEELNKQLNLDHVHWVLSARPPHKDQISATIEHRFKMLQLALQDQPNYLADDTEIARPETSYSIDTITQLQIANPDATLLLIIGADSMANLHTWHRVDDLLELVNVVVLNRPGYPLQVPEFLQKRLLDDLSEVLSFDAGKLAVFEHSEFDISSTRLRELLAKSSQSAEKIVQQYLPPEVLRYILAHQLYETPIMNPEQIKDHVVEALEDIKGLDIKVIDIADISDFADYMVVASGTSDTHVKALAREASDRLRKAGLNPLNEDGADIGEWVLVDFGDVVLHVMRPEVREYYDLEKLWDKDVRKMVKAHREQQDAGS